LITGFVLSFSSTAFALQLLAERKQLTTHYGRTSFAILLFQDLAAIPLLALIPLLAGDTSMGRGDVITAVVKAVVAWDAAERYGRALYFTRAPAPAGDGVLYHHVGLYAYKREALENFVALPPSPLEEREKLEQLRALEAGMSIAVARVDEAPLSVDTPADLERARKILS